MCVCVYIYMDPPPLLGKRISSLLDARHRRAHRRRRRHRRLKYVYVYVYIYTYLIYIYTYIHIYTYIYGPSFFNPARLTSRSST